METIRILVADDEREARELILHYLRESGVNFVAYEAADGRTASEMIESNQPDILFLDIRMPEMSGIELLQKRNSSERPLLIFTTAFDEYALPAFDHEATDYLLKPFDRTRFDKALQKALKYLKSPNEQRKNYLDQLSIKKGNRTRLVPVSEIDYFQSERTYVKVYMRDGSMLMNDPLYELEAKLDPARFIRIHKSVIINSTVVKEVSSLVNGDFIVTLMSGKDLRGSRTYRSKAREILKF